MGSVSDYYNDFYRELALRDAQGNDFHKVAAFVPELRTGARVLDVGAGYGTVSYPLLEKGYAVSAMEINADAVACLKKKGFTVLTQDVSAPFGACEPFDLILLLDILEHVFNPVALLAECARNLAPNGRIIINVPLYFDYLDRIRILMTGSIISYDNSVYGRELWRRFRSFNYDHIRFFRPGDVLEMCEACGLKPDQTEYVAYGTAQRPFLRKVIGPVVRLLPGLLAHSMTVRAMCR